MISSFYCAGEPGNMAAAAAAFNQFQHAGGRAAAFAAAAAAQAGAAGVNRASVMSGGPLGHLASSNNSTKDGEDGTG